MLSNPDRLLILCQLSQGEARVGELEEALGIVQPTLSQQLTVLREEQLVTHAARRQEHLLLAGQPAGAGRDRDPVRAVLRCDSRKAGPAAKRKE